MKIGFLTLLIGLILLNFGYAQNLNSLSYSEIENIEKYNEAKKQLLATEKNLKNSLGTGHPEYISILNKLAELYLVMNQPKQAFAYAITGVALNCDGFDNYFPNVYNPSFSGERYSPSQYNGGIEPAQLKELFNLKFYYNNKQQESINVLLAITKAQYLDAKKNDNPMWRGMLFGHYNIAKAAMKLNENYRNEFTENGNKLRVLKENNDFVKYGIEAALMLEDPVCVAESFAFAEQNKSILLSNAVKGDGARTLGDLPVSLSEKELALQQQKDLIQKKTFEAKTDAEKETLIAAENAINLEVDEFIKSIKNKFPKYHALKYKNTTASVDDIRKLLDDNTLFLEYFVADTMVYLFAINKQKVELFSLSIPKEILKNKIKRFRNDLSNIKYISEKKEEAYNSYTQNANWFYNNLIKIALDGKKVSNLIIVADGELGYLPFEVFLVEYAKQGEQDYKKLHYLLNDYNFSYNYSASLFMDSQQNLKKDKPATKGMLACAAAYSKPDSMVQKLRQPYLFAMREALNPLPAAINEIASLSSNFGGDFLQDEATNEAFFKANAGDYNIIHLAMHGMMNSREPMLSSLVFTENNDTLEDNFLQAYEISRLNLNADLVVLSACETGYGEFEQGEGVLSFARSFMYAGVPSLVVSLWQVNDGSTARIMQSFYQYLSEGKPKDFALRQAKLDYIQNAVDMAAHPAFWSPFIQLGDNRPIKLETKKTWFWWLFGIGAFLVAGGLLVRRNKSIK